MQLVDVDGNTTDAPIASAVLVVDRTPPIVLNARDDVPDELHNDVAQSTLSISFSVNEPTSAATATVAETGAALPCDVQGATYSCAAVVEAFGFVDGDNTIVIEARDLANNAGLGDTVVRVDLAPPAVVAGSVAVTVLGPSGAVVGDLVPTGKVRVELDVSEPLAPGATFALAGATLDDVVVDGRHVAGVLTLVDGDGAAQRDVTFSASDVVGHVSGDIVVAQVDVLQAFAQCTLPDGVSCPDFDGDGQRGAAPGCNAGGAPDCDDTDPLVYTGATEIPADGKVNDCAAPLGSVDVVPDETNGEFVDQDAAPGGDGSRAAPYTTVDDAELAANASGKPFLFVRRGDAFNDVTRSVVGGFDQNWQKTAAVGVISGSDSLVFEALEPIVLVDINIVPICEVASPATLSRFSTDQGVYFSAPVRCIDCDLSIVQTSVASFFQNAAGSILLRTTSGHNVEAEGPITVIDSQFPGVDFYDGGVFLNSITTNGLGCGGEMLVAHSFVYGPLSEGVAAFGNCQLHLLNSGVRAEVGLLITQSGAYDARGSVFDVTNFVGGATDDAAFADCATAPAPPCLAQVANTRGSWVTQPADGFALDTGTPNDAVDRGVDPFAGADPVVVPGSIVRDHDGTCRFDPNDTPDVGPDEAG